MKKLFKTTHNTQLTNLWLLFFRVLAGAFMITHGIPKLQMLLGGGEIMFPAMFGLDASTSLALAVFSELFCSLLIIFGLGTRLATVPLIATMLVAAFVVHADDPFQKKEMALLYLIVFITLLVLGGGKYSVDHRISGR